MAIWKVRNAGKYIMMKGFSLSPLVLVPIFGDWSGGGEELYTEDRKAAVGSCVRKH